MSLISVIIPTLNRPGLLCEAIASIMAQTRPADEIIVVDDGSQPPVEEAILRAEFGSLIKVVRNDESQGLAWARNQGVMAATGEYVAHLDDDDLYAPETLAECTALLDADPELDLVFIGVKGFGSRASHFNRVQPAGVAQVIRQGVGREIAPGVVLFEHSLLNTLLKRVPSAFQHVVIRREIWQQVNQLRLHAYQKAAGLTSELAAMELIRGPLRDSEWALYAAAISSRTVLCDRAYYLARCEGQGGSSQSANLHLHMLQNLEIKTKLFRASGLLPELQKWQRDIRRNLADTHFDIAYAYFQQGQRRLAWHHLQRAASIDTYWKQVKLAIRFFFPSPDNGPSS